MNSQHFVFDTVKELRQPKISASRLGGLANLNEYQPYGNTLLELFGIFKSDEIDGFYKKRGWVLENALKKKLKANGFDYVDYPDNVYDIYDFQKADEYGVVPNEYFSGKPDIKVPKHKVMFECKSKSMKDKEKITNLKPITEVVQGELYLELEKDYKYCYMVWGFFSEELELRIRRANSFEELDKITIDDIGLDNIIQMTTHEVRREYAEKKQNYPNIETVMKTALKNVTDFVKTKTLKYKYLDRYYFQDLRRSEKLK